MRQDCIKAVSQVLGRNITQAEAQKIEKRIGDAKRQLFIKDRQAYLGMSEAQRLQEAGKLAAAEIRHDALKKQQRIASTVLAHDRIQNFVNGQGDGILKSIDRTLAPKFDGQDNFFSADTRAQAVYNEYTRELSGFFDGFGPKILGILSNDKAMIPVFQELRGKHTGIPEAKKFAQKLSDIFEIARKRFNAAGGDIGNLDDWAHPQAHSSYLIFKAGFDAWKNFIMPRLDRSRYVVEAGDKSRMMNDAELTDFLQHAFRSIVYDGQANDTPVKPGAGGGIRANRGNQSRQLHFKDADSYLEYHDKFAEKSYLGTIISHLSGISKDIALVETFGPNPDLQLKAWIKKGIQEAADNNVDPIAVNADVGKIQRLYDEVAGKHVPAGHEGLARVGSSIRSYLGIRLGSAVFSAFSDHVTAVITARALNMSGWHYLWNVLKVETSADMRKQARSLGLGLDTLLFSINRFGQENFSNAFSSKVSGAVIRGSGLSFLTEARRQAFGTLMMHGIGRLVQKHDHLSDLHPKDNAILLSKGITEADWQAWRNTTLEDFGGDKILTPRAVMAGGDKLAADKLMGAILEESSNAIITPGVREQTVMQSKSAAGTIGGELWRSILQFKSFPITLMMRHWKRMSTQTGAISKAEYLAAFVAGTTLMGALGVQLNEIANGRDPIKMDDPKFWMRAFLKGGSLGFYGDFMQSQSTQHGTSAFAGLLGPVAGLSEEFLNMTQGNLIQLMQGEEMHAGAEAVKFIKGITPGTSLWYAKAALDHMIFQKIQEYMSPGYLSRMKQRAMREFKQQYYWEPGKTSPKRAPDFERALP